MLLQWQGATGPHPVAAVGETLSSSVGGGGDGVPRSAHGSGPGVTPVVVVGDGVVHEAVRAIAPDGSSLGAPLPESALTADALASTSSDQLWLAAVRAARQAAVSAAELRRLLDESE